MTSSFHRQVKKHFFHLQTKARAEAKGGSRTSSQVGNPVKTKEKERMPKGKAKMERAKEKEEKEKDHVTVVLNMGTSSETAQVRVKESILLMMDGNTCRRGIILLQTTS